MSYLLTTQRVNANVRIRITLRSGSPFTLVVESRIHDLWVVNCAPLLGLASTTILSDDFMESYRPSLALYPKVLF